MIDANQKLVLTHELQFYQIDFDKLVNNNRDDLLKHLKKIKAISMNNELINAREQTFDEFPTYRLALNVNKQQIIIVEDVTETTDKSNSLIIAVHDDDRLNHYQNKSITILADNIINDYCNWLHKALDTENKIKNSPYKIYKVVNDAKMPILFTASSYADLVISQIDTVNSIGLNMSYLYDKCKSLCHYLLLKKLPNCKQFYVSAFNSLLHYLRFDLTEQTNRDNSQINMIVLMLINLINNNEMDWHYDESIDYDCLFEIAHILHYPNLLVPIKALLLLSKPALSKPNDTKVLFHLNNEKELDEFISQLLACEKYRWDEINVIMSDIYHNLVNDNCIHITINNNLIQAKIDLIRNNFKDATIMQRVANILEILNKNSA